MAVRHLIIIATRDYAAGGTIENIKQGDIVDVWPEDTPLSEYDRTNYLAVIVKNLSDEEAIMLKGLFYDNGADIIEPNDAVPPPALTAKRKYSIPFSEIQRYVPTFDPARAADPYDDYQPLYDNNIIPNAKQALRVYDKWEEDFKSDWNPVISGGV